MRIVHYFFRVNEASGGVSRAIYDLVQLLASVGHDVCLLTGSDSEFPVRWKENAAGISVIRLLRRPGPSGLLDGASRTRVSDVLEAADVLHLHGLWRPSTSQVARIARRTGTPCVLTPHGTLDDWSMRRRAFRKRIFYRLFEARNLTSVAMIHCTARGEQEQSRRWIPHQRIRVIPYALDLEPYESLPSAELVRAAFQIDEKRPSVLFLSRLHKKKRPDLLIRAVAEARRRGQDCQLLFAGTGDAGYVKRLQKLANELVPDTRWLGLVTGREKLSLYRSADLVALPTQQENFALVLPEALACATPVLTTTGTDIWRELEASGGARIAETNVTAFAEGIVELLGQPMELRRMGEVGREWVFDWLDPERITREYESFYRDAISVARGTNETT